MSIIKRRGRKQDYPASASIDGFISTENIDTTGLPMVLDSSSKKKAKYARLRAIAAQVMIAIAMVFIGWYARTATLKEPLFMKKSKVVDPPWWFEDSVDDFFDRQYITGLSGVRKLNNSNFFTGMCGRYRFDVNALPTISVIVTLQNEQPNMLTLTVHTLLARTPPSLLQQVIIVDDNGAAPSMRASVNESELQDLQNLNRKIVIITNTEREGVARSRMNGARRATGEVLVFVDSHVEMLSATWAQHLLLPIVEDPYTVAAQTLDIISDLDWTYGPGSGDLLYGVITNDFWFAYQRSRFGGPDDAGPEREKPGRRLPYETPFTAGSLFAVRRDRFMQIGGYDEGMYVWGGENTDFAIKTWVCGGRLVMVPCSRVGHMYRIHVRDTGRWPPALPVSLTERLGLGRPGDFLVRGSVADNFTRIITRNNIRVMERWARNSSARTGYYHRIFGSDELPPEWNVFAQEMETDPYARAQRKYIQKNGCKDFNWFDKHVYVKLTGVHHPWHPDSPGRTWV